MKLWGCFDFVFYQSHKDYLWSCLFYFSSFVCFIIYIFLFLLFPTSLFFFPIFLLYILLSSIYLSIYLSIIYLHIFAKQSKINQCFYLNIHSMIKWDNSHQNSVKMILNLGNYQHNNRFPHCHRLPQTPITLSFWCILTTASINVHSNPLNTNSLSQL